LDSSREPGMLETGTEDQVNGPWSSRLKWFLRLSRAGIPRYREKAPTAPVKRTFLVNKGGTAEAPSLATGAFLF
jgi:hypothetical protein